MDQTRQRKQYLAHKQRINETRAILQFAYSAGILCIQSLKLARIDNDHLHVFSDQRRFFVQYAKPPQDSTGKKAAGVCTKRRIEWYVI